MELRLTARRGENVLVTIVIPIAVLLFFAGTSVIPNATGRPVDFLLPGAIALGIIASGLVNLGIATAYERAYGVLKRLGGAPLPRWAILAAKATSVLVLELVQILALIAVGVIMLGWAPGSGWSPILFGVAALLGTVTFVGLGLLLGDKLWARFADLPPDRLADDETFWSAIRAKYRLKPDYINLESGYYTIQATPVLEAFIARVREINYQGSYYLRTTQVPDKAAIRDKLAAIAGCAPGELCITRNTT